MKNFKAHKKPILDLVFAPDGRSIVTSSADGSVRQWSLETQQQLNEWSGSAIHAPLAFSPDGQWIACGGYGTHAWNAATGAKLPMDCRYGHSVAFSPDATVLAVQTDYGDGLMRLKVPSGEKLAGGWGGTRESTAAARFATGGMAFSPDGAMLATTFGELIPGRYASVVFLWDAATGEEQAKLTVTKYSDHPVKLTFSPDGRLLAGASGSLVHIWDVRGGPEIGTLQLGKKHFKSQVFSFDGQTLMTVGQDDVVSRWTSEWSIIEPFDPAIGKLTAITRSDFACKQKIYGAGSATGWVAVWDTL